MIRWRKPNSIPTSRRRAWSPPILIRLPGVPWTSSSRGRVANQSGATGATAMAKWLTWRRKLCRESSS